MFQVLDKSVYSVLQVITVFSAWLDTNEEVLDPDELVYTTVHNVAKLFFSPQLRIDRLLKQSSQDTQVLARHFVKLVRLE